MTLPEPGAISRQMLKDIQEPFIYTIREKSGNRGKWIDLMNKLAEAPNGSPWCASFQFTRLFKAASKLKTTLPKDFTPRAYTPTWANYFKTKKLSITVAQAIANPSILRRGDMVLFYHSDMQRIAHIGCVIDFIVEAGKIVGIISSEGNTNDNGSREGIGVFKRQHRFSSMNANSLFGRVAF